MVKSIEQDVSWSGIEKIGFRFSFIYFILFIVFQNNGAYPFWSFIYDHLLSWIKFLIPWLGDHIYGISDVTIREMTGSGDTLFDYVTILTIFLIAVVGCIFWSLIDRKRNNYHTLYYWLSVALRYFVALMLINYGFSKVIQLQFPYPGPYRMLNTFGQTSPMGLAWTFLGFSKGYNLFMGIAELMAGLLLFRRTLTLGLIITLMTTLNIMAVNYFYDVPVKIMSTHLVIITLFLLSRDFKTLYLFFFTPLEKKLSILRRPFFKKKLNFGLNIIKTLILGYAFIYGFIEAKRSDELYGQNAEKPLLYGAYKVKDVVINKDTLNNYRDKKLWSNISFQWSGSLRIQRYRSPTTTFYGFKKDSLKNILKLTSWSNPSDYFHLNYDQVDSISVNFEYIKQTDTIKIYTQKYTKDNFNLSQRTFNWVSEYPYNQ